MIESLMYLASATRPDILFVVSKLSRFTINPGDELCTTWMEFIILGILQY
jgi:hypothetical protein